MVEAKVAIKKIDDISWIEIQTWEDGRISNSITMSPGYAWSLGNDLIKMAGVIDDEDKND